MDIHHYLKQFSDRPLHLENKACVFGLPFEDQETQPRSHRVNASCWACGNGGASLVRGWKSPACMRCETGEASASFYVSLQCPRNCYFCFNRNQEHYEQHRHAQRDIAAELRYHYLQETHFDFLAITGGEPLLHFDHVVDFLHAAGELYPDAHTRLYTSGWGFSKAHAQTLGNTGLDEIRFSVKIDEGKDHIVETLSHIIVAVNEIDTVMVEMPVIPGTSNEMCDLLVDLDAIGVKGINLLEFGFPFANAQEYAHRGFRLRKNPYSIVYDYWYAGGLPVAGSETACLALLRFAEEADLSLGVHYCSLDNKNTGQVYQQNKPFLADPAVAAQFAHCEFGGDHFLNFVKSFGDDALKIRDHLSEGGRTRYYFDEQLRTTSFHPSFLGSVQATFPDAELAFVSGILEQEEDGALSIFEADAYRMEEKQNTVQ